MASEDQLQNQREKNDALREKVAEAKRKGASAVIDTHADVELAQLEAEEARLENELAEAEEAAKKATVRKGAALPLGQAKEQMRQEVARGKAAEKVAEDVANAAKEAASADTQANGAGEDGK